MDSDSRGRPPGAEGSRGGADGCAPAGPRWAFSAGTLLAGRYRVLRPVARGGMGEVYEAEDLDLGERVALKTIRQDIAASEDAVRRFRREVQLARRVTDPHVCRIHDLFHHRPGAGDRGGDVRFVTMQWLDGETLAERLSRVGRMSTEEALPLAIQLAAALTAAHRAGVVHRDFKSSNVMLVPTSEAPSGLRAVVTDFGLARRSAEFAGTATAAETITHQIAGTPAYMAPEQLLGRPVTAAADLYAFGIVLYEMVTGKLPFHGENPLAAALRRLREEPTAPRGHVPDLDPGWETAILRCLRHDPADRFPSAEELARALIGSVPAPTPAAWRWQWVAAAAGSALLVAALAVVPLLRIGRSPPHGEPTAAVTAPRRSVAVLGFKNLSGQAQAAWLSAAFAEMLTTELGAGGRLRTIPGENVVRMKQDLGLADADSFAPDTLARIGSHLSADVVVFGAYIALGSVGGERLRLDLRLQETGDGGTIALLSEEGNEAGLLSLVSRAGERLRAALGAADVSSVEVAGVRSALPANPEAARLYAEGLSQLRLFEPLTARDLFTRAVAADPQSAPARAALAEAYSALGYDARAAEEAGRALELARGLAREERLAIEGRYSEIIRDWERAIVSFGTLFRLHPDDVEHGLRLTSNLTSAGRGQEAEATLAALRALPRVAAQDPRIDLAEAALAENLGDFRRARAAAAAAAERARQRGGGLLVARARTLEGHALLQLGEMTAAGEAFAEARELASRAGDRGGLAGAIGMLGLLRFRQTDYAQAARLYTEALEIQRETGDRRGEAVQLNSLASALSELHDSAGARRAYEESLAIRREIDDQRGVAGVLGNLANLWQYEGDLAASQTLHEQSLTIHRQIGDRRGEAIELNNIAVLLLLRGELTQAKRLLEEALGIKRSIGARSSIAFTLTDLGRLLLSEGDLEGARRRFEEALAIRSELGETQRVAGSRLALAAVALELGEALAAAEEAEALADDYAAAGDVAGETEARVLLARALLANGDTGAAATQADRAAAILPAKVDLATRLSALVAIAEVQAASRGRADTAARAALEDYRSRASRSGLVGLELEARLALGVLELATPRQAGARTALAAIAREAEEKGFGLIARRARSLGG